LVQFETARRARQAQSPERIMSIRIGELCQRLILTLTNQEVEEAD